MSGRRGKGWLSLKRKKSPHICWYLLTLHMGNLLHVKYQQCCQQWHIVVVLLKVGLTSSQSVGLLGWHIAGGYIGRNRVFFLLQIASHCVTCWDDLLTCWHALQAMLIDCRGVVVWFSPNGVLPTILIWDAQCGNPLGCKIKKEGFCWLGSQQYMDRCQPFKVDQTKKLKRCFFKLYFWPRLKFLLFYYCRDCGSFFCLSALSLLPFTPSRAQAALTYIPFCHSCWSTPQLLGSHNL